MARAQGARSQLYGAFESTYGTPPTNNWFKLPFITCNLGAEQGLIEDDVINGLRDPSPPIRDVVVDNGDVVVPLDVRNIGFWLKALLGAPVTADNKARGEIVFSVNPSATQTITIDGVAFTFVAGAPTGNQIQIGADLNETLDNAVSTLNASVDVDVAAATYSTYDDTKTLYITHDATGAGGNSFTLAASHATVSAATLTGGEAKTHAFLSGATSLPSIALEVGHPQVPKYFMNAGVGINSMAFEFVRSGGARATFNCIAQGESPYASSQVGTNSTLALVRFNQFQGSISKSEVALANVTRVTGTYSNNMETVEVIRSDGKIEGVDPTKTSLTGELNLRFADSTLLDLATNGTPVALEFKYKISNSQLLKATLPEVYLPKPKMSINGPGGIEALFNYQASYNSTAQYMMGMVLVNDVASY